MRYNLLSGQNALTANGRFGAMAAVTPQKSLCVFEISTPQQQQWKPPLPQAAGTLCAMCESAVDKAVKTEK